MEAESYRMTVKERQCTDKVYICKVFMYMKVSQLIR